MRRLRALEPNVRSGAAPLLCCLGAPGARRSQTPTRSAGPALLPHTAQWRHCGATSFTRVSWAAQFAAPGVGAPAPPVRLFAATAVAAAAIATVVSSGGHCGVARASVVAALPRAMYVFSWVLRRRTRLRRRRRLGGGLVAAAAAVVGVASRAVFVVCAHVWHYV